MKPVKRLVLIIVLLFPLPGDLAAQWIPQPTGIQTYVNDIKSYDGQFVYAVGNNCFIRTLNGGSTWDSLPFLNMIGLPYPSAYLETVHFISPQIGFATGIINIGNDYMIFKTVNGGSNWSIQYNSNSSLTPRIFNKIYFVNSLIGWCVGTNGRVLSTSDGGNTWVVNNIGTLATLNDVFFTSTTTGYIVGSSVIAKTFDGGASWIITYIPHDFSGVHFPTATTGYAVGAGNIMFKTTDSGQNWVQMPVNVPGTNNISSVYFSSIDTGYVSTTGIQNYAIMKTTNGGTNWHKFNTPVPMNDVSFRNQSDGWACGDAGTIFHTTNTGNPYTPVSYFNWSPSTVCHDSLVSFNNLSAQGYTYSWLFNNIPFSTSYHASMQFTNPGQSVTIALVVSNGGSHDTSFAQFNVSQSLTIPPISGTVSNSLICAGNNVQFFVPNSQLGTSYSLKIGTTTIGSVQPGNGDTLTFNSGTITSTTTFTIYAERTISGCGTNDLAQNIMVTTGNPQTNLTVSPTSSGVCQNASINITVSNSENSVIYQLKNGTTLIGSPVTGNGGTISLNTGPVTVNTTFTIHATSPNGCTSVLAQSINLTVEYPEAAFGLSNINPLVGEVISTSNGSINPGGTYEWSFGSAASIPSSTLPFVPALSYSAAGLYNVSLIAISPNNCRDTLWKTIHVHGTIQTPACNTTVICGNTSDYGLSGIAFDPLDNGTVAIYMGGNTYNGIMSYGVNNDSINDETFFNSTFDNVNYLIKFNAAGTPMWSTKILSGSEWMENPNVVVDSLGNIYFSFNHGTNTDNVKAFSSDGSFVTFQPAIAGSLDPYIVFKYSNTGQYIWHRYQPGFYTDQNYKLKLDPQQNIYHLAETKISKWDPQGNLIYEISKMPPNFEEFADVSFHPSGDLLVLTTNKMVIRRYNSTGTFVSASSPVSSFSYGGSSGIIVDSRFLPGSDTTVYITGSFLGGMVFNGDSLTNYIGYTGSQHPDPFIAKLGINGQQYWIQQLQSPATGQIHGFDLKDDKLIYFATLYQDTVYFQNLPAITCQNNSYYFYVCDTAGNSVNASKLYEIPSGGVGAFINNSTLYSRNQTNDDVAVGIKYYGPFGFGTIMPDVYSGFANNYNYASLRGSLNCFVPGFAPAPPVSYFSTQQDTFCVGEQIYLQDLSANSPTSWDWTITGATPSTSVVQNPVITYMNAGTYQITLAASNSLGTGASFSKTITIVTASAVSISGDTLVCPGTPVVLTATGTGNYTWSTGDVNSTITVYPTVSTLFTVQSSNGICSASDSILVQTFPEPVPVIATIDPIRICVGDSVHFTVNSNYSAYQWYRGLNQIGGAITNSYTATQKGAYSCHVTDSIGCTGISNFITVRVICLPPDDPEVKIEDPLGNITSERSVTIQPNPSRGDFTIISDCETVSDLALLSVSGTTINTKFHYPDKQTIYITDVPPGIYFLRLKCTYEMHMIKLVSTGY